MHFVYILESEDAEHWYVGVTSDLNRRMLEHNRGHSTHTSKYTNWKLKNYFAFVERRKAEEFEKYLKSHSGRAFSKKHF